VLNDEHAASISHDGRSLFDALVYLALLPFEINTYGLRFPVIDFFDHVFTSAFLSRLLFFAYQVSLL
jgi:hypothetical protein